jgi:hypothetical protein
MTIPVEEIPQEQQDEIIASADPIGSLPDAVKDRVVRELHACWSSPAISQAYLTLFKGTLLNPDPHFGDLSEEQQTKILDTFALAPTIGTASDIAAVLDVVASMAAEVKEAVVSFVARPLRFRDAPEELRDGCRSVDLSEMGIRLSTLLAVLTRPAFVARSGQEQRCVVIALDGIGVEGLHSFVDLLVPTSSRWLAGSAYPVDTVPLFTEDFLEGITLARVLERAATAPINWQIGAVVGVPLIVRAPPSESDMDFSPPTWLPPNVMFLPQRTAMGDLLDIGLEASEGFARDYEEDRRRRMVLALVVCEVANPDRYVNQDNRDTCALTSLSHRLALIRPAEYARMACDLYLGDYDGRVSPLQQSRLANGDAIRATDDSLDADGSYRSTSERLLQTALAVWWMMGRAYDPRYRGPTYHNLWRSRRASSGNASGLAHDHFDADHGFEEKYHRLVEIVLNARFERVSRNCIERARAHFQSHPLIPLLAALDWGNGAHQIDLLGFESGPGHAPRILFWNPWGAAQMALMGGVFPISFPGIGVGRTNSVSVHRSHKDPPVRRTRDQWRGTQTMSVATFRSLVNEVLIPK